METESGAKIAIRGKGSVKEGKGRSDAAHGSNQEEDLHCLIMADTEEKVNKAKKLVHNVIETVSSSTSSNWGHFSDINMIIRLHQFLRAKTNSSVTNCVNSLLLTVPSVTTRTRLARTVSGHLQIVTFWPDSHANCDSFQAVKLDTVSMTALSSVTSLRTLSVVSVAMLATWLAIVQTAREAVTGATLAPTDVALVLALVMLWIVRWRYVSLYS